MINIPYRKLVALCLWSMFTNYAMQELEIAPREIFLDGGSGKENIGNLSFPQIGVYATPYDMAVPILAVHSHKIVDSMPEVIIKQLADLYTLAGSAHDIKTALRHKVATQELNVAVVFWQGLATQPQTYNAVFHPIVGGWLGLNYTASFNVPIQAGIFMPQGVQPSSDAPLAFNALGALDINRHNVDNYSPNNGKFAVESGRKVVSFWLMGFYNGRATVSYNIFIIAKELQQELQDAAEVALLFPDAEQQIAQFTPRMEQLVKQLESEGQRADSNALYDALQVVRNIADIQPTALEPITPVSVMPPPPPPLKPIVEPRTSIIVPRIIPDVSGDLFAVVSELEQLSHSL